MPTVAAGAVGIGGERDAQKAQYEPEGGPAHRAGYWRTFTRKEPHTGRREAAMVLGAEAAVVR